MSFAPAVLYYGLIFWLSSQPNPLGARLPGSDKLHHGAAFGLLGFLLAVGYFAAFRLSRTQKAAWVVVTGVGLGILDELHQMFTPGRTLDVFDVVSDAAGVALGLLVYWIAIGKKKAGQERRQRPSSGRARPSGL